MKRPTRKRVEEAIRRDYMRGRNTYIEAVELEDGMMVVEYEHRSKAATRLGHEYTIHCSRRLLIVTPDGRPRDSIIVTSWFETPQGKRKTYA